MVCSGCHMPCKLAAHKGYKYPKYTYRDMPPPVRKGPLHGSLLCKNPDCRKGWDRDRNASRNILYVFQQQLLHNGTIPEPFDGGPKLPTYAQVSHQDKAHKIIAADYSWVYTY